MEFESAYKAVEKITSGWNLGNTFDSCGTIKCEYSAAAYETLWFSPIITKEMISAVKNAGFNAVRLPVTWNAHADENGNIKPEWMNRIEEVVNYILGEDMYCIINVHHDSGEGGWILADEEFFEKTSRRFSGIWKNISERFINYGEKLMFEGFNEMLDIHKSWTEPRSDDAYFVHNRYNQLFVDTVRATGGNNRFRNLVLQTYSGGESLRTMNKFSLAADAVCGHLIAEIHNYDPQGFCWLKAKDRVMRDSWGTDEDLKEIDNLVSRAEEFSKRINAPVIIGEYGSQDKNNESERAKHAGYIVSKAAEAGIKCFWWDTVGAFALLDRKNVKMQHKEIIDAIMSSVK